MSDSSSGLNHPVPVEGCSSSASVPMHDKQCTPKQLPTSDWLVVDEDDLDLLPIYETKVRSGVHFDSLAMSEDHGVEFSIALCLNGLNVCNQEINPRSITPIHLSCAHQQEGAATAARCGPMVATAIKL